MGNLLLKACTCLRTCFDHVLSPGGPCRLVLTALPTFERSIFPSTESGLRKYGGRKEGEEGDATEWRCHFETTTQFGEAWEFKSG